MYTAPGKRLPMTAGNRAAHRLPGSTAPGSPVHTRVLLIRASRLPASVQSATCKSLGAWDSVACKVCKNGEVQPDLVASGKLLCLHVVACPDELRQRRRCAGGCCRLSGAKTVALLAAGRCAAPRTQPCTSRQRRAGCADIGIVRERLAATPSVPSLHQACAPRNESHCGTAARAWRDAGCSTGCRTCKCASQEPAASSR